ncbi:MAG: NACHT domain-containing protein, partial [Gammaproteobacteria bacterium]
MLNMNRIKQKTIDLFHPRLHSQYVKLKATIGYDYLNPIDLMTDIFTVIKKSAHYDVLLLAGNAGSGKSWFGQQLTLQLYQKKSEDASLPFPLWTPLLTIENPETDLLRKHLEYNLHLSEEEIDEFFNNTDDLLLILDGYDELKTNANLYDQNRFNTEDCTYKGRIKTIITTRYDTANASIESDRTAFIPNNNTEKLRQYTTYPFEKTQINEVIEKFVLSKSRIWSAKRYSEEIEGIPELAELVKKPYLLSLTLKCLPSIIDNIKAEQATKIKITRRELYQYYMNKWFHREALKLSHENTQKVLSAYRDKGFESIETVFQNFTLELAKSMYGHRQYSITWVPKSIISNLQLSIESDARFSRSSTENEESKKLSNSNWSKLLLAGVTGAIVSKGRTKKNEPNEPSNPAWLIPFFDDAKDPTKTLYLLRNACPLDKIGNNTWAFTHDSLVDYFAAEHLFDGAIIDSWIIAGQNFNDRNLQYFPEIIDFLVDHVRKDKTFKALLFKIIDYSKIDAHGWKAAANAITILNRAKISLSGRDFKKIRIGGETSIGKADRNCMHFKIISLPSQSDYENNHISWKHALEAETFYLIYFEDKQQWFVHCQGRRETLLSKPLIDITAAGDTDISRLLKLLKRPSELSQENMEDLEYKFRALNLPITERWGADLSFALLNNTDLSDSDLRYVNLFQAQLSDAVFDRACMDGISIGQNPAVFCEDFSLVPRENYFAVYNRGWFWQNGNLEFFIYPDSTQFALSSAVSQKKWTRKITIDAMSVASNFSSVTEKWFATAYKKKLYIWDINSEKLIKSVKTGVACKALAWSQDMQLAFVGANGKLLIFDQNLKILHTLTSVEKFTSPMAWSSDSSRIACVASNNSIQIWSKITSKIIILNGHSDKINCLTWSPNGILLATGSQDKTVKIWDIHQVLCINTLNDHTNPVTAIDWSSQGNLLASGETVQITEDDGFFSGGTLKKGSIYLRVMPYGDCIQIYQSHKQPSFTRIAFDKNAHRILAVSVTKLYLSRWLPLDKQLAEWQINISTQMRDRRTAHTETVESICWSPDGKYFASISLDKTIRIWEYQNKKCVKILKGFSKVPTALEWSPDGKFLLSGHISDFSYSAPYSSTNKAMIHIWDIETGEIIHTLLAHTYAVYGLAFSPTERYFASAGSSGVLSAFSEDLEIAQTSTPVKIWNYLQTPPTLVQKPWHGLGTVRGMGVFNCVAWSPKPNDKYLAFGGDDMKIYVWDIEKNRLRFQFAPDPGSAGWPRLHSLAWSPDGKYLVSGDGNFDLILKPSVKIWEMNHGLCLKIFDGYKYSIFSVDWSPNGALIASAEADDFKEKHGSIKIWDFYQEINIAVLHYPAPVRKVKWQPQSTPHPNKQYLLFSAANNMVGLWKVFKKTDNAKWQTKLKWQTTSNSGLLTDNMSFANAYGLKNEISSVFQQVSTGSNAHGSISNQSSQEILRRRDRSIHIPEGQFDINIKVSNGEEIRNTITHDHWLFAIVRKKNEPNGHVSIIIQGIDENNFSDFREIHF